MTHDLVNDPHNLFVPDPPKKGWVALVNVKELYLREVMENGVIVGYEINTACDVQFPHTCVRFVNVDV